MKSFRQKHIMSVIIICYYIFSRCDQSNLFIFSINLIKFFLRKIKNWLSFLNSFHTCDYKNRFLEFSFKDFLTFQCGDFSCWKFEPSSKTYVIRLRDIGLHVWLAPPLKVYNVNAKKASKLVMYKIRKLKIYCVIITPVSMHLTSSNILRDS